MRNGIFDDFDLKRIPDSIKVSFQKPRILLVEALDRYMKATPTTGDKEPTRILMGFQKSYK